MKRGDLVEVRLPNAKDVRMPPRFYGVIVGVVGTDNAIVMDVHGATCQPLLTSCRPVKAVGPLLALRRAILRHARSDAGKAAIKNSRARASARYERKTLGGRLVRIDIDIPILPGGGHGAGDKRLEPWVLTEGKTGIPTEQLLDHIDWWGARMVAAREQLSPALRDAVTLVIDRDMSHAEAAEHLGISPHAVGQRMYLARAALRRSVGTSRELLSPYSARRGQEVGRRG